MKYFITIILLVSLSVSYAYAADYNEFVKISDGHYAKLSEDGTLTEVATSEEAVSQLNKESSDENVKSLKDSIIKGFVVATPGFNMCLGSQFGETNQYHNINLDQNSIEVIGSAIFGSHIGPPPPAPPYLQTNLRIKTKIKAFDLNHSLIGKVYSIDRQFAGLVTTSKNNNTIQAIWNSVGTSVSMPLNSNIKSVTWVVRSDFMVDNPSTLNGTVPSDQDCYQTQQIKTSNQVFF